MMHIPKQQRIKLDSKSEMITFVGYSETTKGYRLADPEKTGKINKVRDVIFLEGKQLSTERKEESGIEHLVVDLDQQMEQPDDQEDSECDHSDDNLSDSEYLPSDSSTEESLAIEEGNAHQEDSGSETSSNSEQNPEQEREIPLLRRSSRTV